MADTPLGYYKWFPRDFYSSITVKSMSFVGRSIFRELLDIQWESERLPSAQRLTSVLQVSAEQWAEFAPYLEELFPDGQNPRLKSLRDEAVIRCQKCSESGSKGGKAKRTKTKRQANAKGSLSQTETETETETPLSSDEDKGEDGDQQLFVEPVPHWFESHPHPVLQRIMPGLLSCTSGGKVVFTPESFSETPMLKVCDRLGKSAPDMETIDRFIQSLVDYCASKKSPPYSMPSKVLNDWLDKREADWLKLKQARGQSRSGETLQEKHERLMAEVGGDQ